MSESGDVARANHSYLQGPLRHELIALQVLVQYRHWQGLAHTLNSDAEAATHAYVRAANIRAELGRPSVKAGKVELEHDVTPGSQAKRIQTMLSQKRPAFLKKLSEVRKALKYSPETNASEQALCDLGTLLGLEASRPEREFKTGPDVLWRSPTEKAGAAIEAKTNKQPPSQYKKKEDIAQFHDHVEWLQKKRPDETFVKAIVGRKLAVSKDANPPPDLRVITVDQFTGLVDRLQSLVEFIDSTARTKDLDISIERALRHIGLIWPNCIESLESSLAIDLQQLDSLEGERSPSGGD